VLVDKHGACFAERSHVAADVRGCRVNLMHDFARLCDEEQDKNNTTINYSIRQFFPCVYKIIKYISSGMTYFSLSSLYILVV
jgi:hypothetical protein